MTLYREKRAYPRLEHKFLELERQLDPKQSLQNDPVKERITTVTIHLLKKIDDFLPSEKNKNE